MGEFIIDTDSGLLVITGNPVACAVGLEVLAVIRDEQLQENATVLGKLALSKVSECYRE